jgi:hypothetical protein
VDAAVVPAFESGQSERGTSSEEPVVTGGEHGRPPLLISRERPVVHCDDRRTDRLPAVPVEVSAEPPTLEAALRELVAANDPVLRGHEVREPVGHPDMLDSAVPKPFWSSTPPLR